MIARRAGIDLTAGSASTTAGLLGVAAELVVVAFGLVAVAALVVVGCAADSERYGEAHRAPVIPNVIDGVVFEAGDWEPHLAPGSEGLSWGNHRAVVTVEVADDTPAVMVTIPWRRPDPNPAAKSVVVVDATSGMPVANAFATRVESVSGDVVFQPDPTSSTYHVYYMPWESTGGYYPRVTYPSAVYEPDEAWRRQVLSAPIDALPKGRTTRIQSVDSFHSFFPMEVIATPGETADFLAETVAGWTLVPEHRDYPVRMRRHLPHHWVVRGKVETFASRVLRDESFTFQLAAVAGDDELSNLRVAFAGFPDEWRENLTCFNCGGIDETGSAFAKEISVEAGSIQPLWIGVRVPVSARPGRYQGDVVVSTDNRGTKTVRVDLEVVEDVARNAGFDDPELMTRLPWLNSTLGADPDFVIEPFEPVRIEGHSLSILGRRIELGESGLPDAIWSYFAPEMTHLANEPEPILALPLDLIVLVDGAPQRLRSEPYDLRPHGRGAVRWEVARASELVSMTVHGTLEYDGVLDYRIALVAKDDVDIDDVVLGVALVPGAAEYMLGLGRRGGKRPVSFDWSWDTANHQEGVWLGGINRGLQYVLRAENYERPLNTNFYRNQPLRMPPSWFNEGRGGIRIQTEADAVTAHNYSGPRRLHAGETLNFNVRFLITPFKTLETERHFNTRFVHRYVPVETVREWGGTVVNVHHANEINPYINYPFFNLEQQAAYIDEAHEKGIKVKLYYTIRELTYKAHELFALRSLGDEILNDGEGGGHSWMQEHLRSDYHSAWHAWRVDDAAMLDKGTSRWTNYYIEGLSWLAANQQIDGLYLDDIAFSRATVKRIVNVLHQQRDEVIIDLHSANQFNERDGFINSAMLYMEHFPFIDRLWFGEYFEYGRDEDYWLTEVSGIPFGLMGEMLQDGGHPYRGMLYGMTARMYGEVDPRPVWRMMDGFGIAESRMLGYWLPDAPVKTDHPRVLATTYVGPDGALIALASWSDTDEIVGLDVDLARLGLGPDSQAHAPAIEGLQAASEVDPAAVRVPAGQGLFVLMR